MNFIILVITTYFSSSFVFIFISSSSRNRSLLSMMYPIKSDICKYFSIRVGFTRVYSRGYSSFSTLPPFEDPYGFYVSAILFEGFSSPFSFSPLASAISLTTGSLESLAPPWIYLTGIVIPLLISSALLDSGFRYSDSKSSRSRLFASSDLCAFERERESNY